FAYSIGADFQLLRVWRAWSVDRYVPEALALAHTEHGRNDELREYAALHEAALRASRILRPEVYIAVALRPRSAWMRGAIGRWLGELAARTGCPILAASRVGSSTTSLPLNVVPSPAPKTSSIVSRRQRSSCNG